MEDYTKKQEEELRIAKIEFESQDRAYNQHTEVVKKMRSFLAMAGENKSKETNELFREHIPESVFGISSDEISSDLGISENELMAKITNGLHIKGNSYLSTKIRVAKIILSVVEKKIAKMKKRHEQLKEKFGCVYYSELRTGLPLNALYYLGGES